MRRLVVIGAGPIGLSAALGALAAGFDATVIEKGEVGDAMRRWGPVRLFSPAGMNLPARALAMLGSRRPADDALMTGPQMADDLLVPLVEMSPLAGRVMTGHRVVGVGRAGLTRLDLAGHPLRAERPFNLVVATIEGDKRLEADIVMDATGVYDTPAFAGLGGLPARGETAAGERIIRHLGAIEREQARLRGRRTLLVGHGHSAANALLMLERLAGESPDSRVIWATRSANRRPVAETAADPLPERQRVACRANDLAAEPPAWLTLARRASIESLAPVGEGGQTLRVGLSSGDELVVDQIIALTGYRPDLSFLSELAIEISEVTEGAARLSRALSGVTECLTVPEVGPGDLDSGEPGFYLIGSKAYGRSRAFLIRTGLAQVERILEEIR